MKKLTSTQAKYLRGIAHDLKPVVFLGQKGLTDALISSTEDAFDRHELIKIKFIDFKEKNQKTKMAEALEVRTGSHLVGIIGHIAILYRQHPDPESQWPGRARQRLTCLRCANSQVAQGAWVAPLHEAARCSERPD